MPVSNKHFVAQGVSVDAERFADYIEIVDRLQPGFEPTAPNIRDASAIRYAARRHVTQDDAYTAFGEMFGLQRCNTWSISSVVRHVRGSGGDDAQYTVGGFKDLFDHAVGYALPGSGVRAAILVQPYSHVIGYEVDLHPLVDVVQLDLPGVHACTTVPMIIRSAAPLGTKLTTKQEEAVTTLWRSYRDNQPVTIEALALNGFDDAMQQSIWRRIVQGHGVKVVTPDVLQTRIARGVRRG